MEEVEKIREYLKDLVLVMANRAEKEVDAIMPGYTHVQVRCHASDADRRTYPNFHNSEPNPSDGHICSSPTHTPFTPISTDYPNSSPESPSSPSVAPH
jgi:hypothetical protein